MTEVQREYCGGYYDKRELGAHQAHCDAAQEEHNQPDYDDIFEAKLRAQYGHKCVSCGAQTELTFHTIDPDTDRELRDVVTLYAARSSYHLWRISTEPTVGDWCSTHHHDDYVSP